MDRVNSLESLLLKNWDEVIRVKEGAQYLEQRMDELLGIIKKSLPTCRWWGENLIDPVYLDNTLRFEKQLGIKDLRNRIEIGIENITLDNLLGQNKVRPVSYIRFKKIGKDKKDLARIIDRSTRNLRRPLEFRTITDPEYVLYYELPHSPKEWAEMLIAERFTETIIRYFEDLIQFIAPIEQAISELGAGKI
jgi:hypothetical protein